MDGPWRRPWKSTVAEVNQELLTRYAKKHSYLQPPDPTDVERLKTELRRQTLLLTWRDKSAWLKRGKVLLNLQYPELAVGDLWKALQIAQGQSKETAVLLLGQGLFLANSFLECIEILNQATRENSEVKRLRRYAQDSLEKEQGETMANDDSSITSSTGVDPSGEVIIQHYPWIRSTWLARRSSVILEVNKRLSKESGSLCQVRRSDLNSSTPDCYGIFTTAAAAKGRGIFADEAVLNATSGPSRRCGCCAGELTWNYFKAGCCESPAEFCSWSCVQKAKNTYHKAMCSKSIDDSNAKSELLSGTSDDEASDRLWMRLLAVIKQSMDTDLDMLEHPLDVPIVNQFTSRADSVVRFSLKRDIAEPNQALQRLGVNVFNDLSFDTWVLRTVAGRLETNNRHVSLDTPYLNGSEETYMLAINPLFSFLNHSCEPNVEVIIDDEHQNSTVLLRAKRKLRKDEELFISYLDEDQLRTGYEERAEALKALTGGACNCSKCRRERDLLYHGTDDEYEPGEADSSSESDSSNEFGGYEEIEEAEESSGDERV